MATERNNKFWLDNELQLSSFQSKWYKHLREEEAKKQVSPDYSMRGVLDRELERNFSNRITIVGPMMDTFLKEIGISFKSKLSRSKVTGVCGPLTMMIPWQVFRTLLCIFIGYKADTRYISGKKKGSSKEKQIVFIEQQSSAEKIWSPSRFDGTNYLCKRFFTKNKSKQTMYNRCAKIVVSKHTPIRMDYFFETQRLQMTYYIQRYDINDVALDLSLQNLINLENDTTTSTQENMAVE